jgi:hypothetical protein
VFLRRARVAPAALAVAVALSANVAAGADPPEHVSTIADQRSVNVTIYNGGQALVHDRRRISLAKGANRLAWRDVSGSLDATSAIVRDTSDPGGLTVDEQNFDFSVLSPQSLLARSVGHEVTIVHDVPVPGRPAREPATVLANNDGIVLQYADRIETNLAGSHVSFDGIPSDLRDRPTLVLDLESARAGEADLDLAYLSGGLGWSANYVGVVSPDRAHLDLSGLVTLTNTSGTAYRNARLQLVAGNVNVGAQLPSGALMREIPEPAAAPMRQENYFEYHLYTLARPTTIANGQTKQVALLAARHVPIRETLELRGSPSYYGSENADLGEKLPVGAYVSFKNTGGDLGVPLPGGIVRLYENDARGTSQFLGSDTIDHTPRNQDVRLHVGDSFDVTANKKQTAFKALGSCRFESAYEIRLANAKDTPQRVDVVEPIPGDWTMLTESAPHRKTSSSTATWSLAVGPNRTVTLDYRVRTNECG